ncbi:MAG TPA: peptidase M6 [Actinomycetota bacterium]
MSRKIVSISLALVLVGGLLSQAAPAAPGGNTAPAELEEVSPDLNDGKPLPLDLGAARESAKEKKKKDGNRHGRRKLRVGLYRQWLAADDIAGELYLKRFKLRGIGKHIEVWVAHDHDTTSKNLGFQYGDCRNDERRHVTNAQVRYLVREFDRNMYPKESKAFSRPPKRDGRDALLPQLIQQRKDYYAGPGQHVVALIDNVRDENFYDLDNSEGQGYTGGFFSSQLNELFDRNVMTIDSWDWLHRTRKNPPDDPAPGDFCKSAPARPFLYESTFAHEYQHLLEYYTDPDEGLWVNEGLSMWIETLVGYSFPKPRVRSKRHFPHLQAFLGWLSVQTGANPNPYEAGPENSLNVWGDQTGDEILADYGGAYSFLAYLADLYGNEVMKRMHRSGRNGLDSLEKILQVSDPDTTAQEALHRWLVTVAMDKILDDGAKLAEGDAGWYRAKSLSASINWDNPDAYSTPGSPPNGADFVRLRDGSGAYLNAGDIDRIEFDGASTLPPLPVEWVVDEDPPEHDGDAALYSGQGDNLDRAIVRRVTVPADDPTLTFETFFDIEESYDGAFVQVSTDGGETYDTLANENTSTEWSSEVPGPGLTGNSGGWRTETFDLGDYAGQEVLLSFRYITDGAVAPDGWWIDDVSVGGTVISDGGDLDPWDSPSEVNAVEVAGFTLQLVAYDDDHDAAWIHQVPLEDGFDATLTGDDLRDAIGDSAETVAAIVTYDEPTEMVNQYAPYELDVNGARQPGGS